MSRSGDSQLSLGTAAEPMLAKTDDKCKEMIAFAACGEARLNCEGELMPHAQCQLLPRQLVRTVVLCIRLRSSTSSAVELSSLAKNQPWRTCRALPRRLFTWDTSSTMRHQVPRTGIGKMHADTKPMGLIALCLQAASEEPLRKALQTYSELGIVRWAKRTGNQGVTRLLLVLLCVSGCSLSEFGQYVFEHPRSQWWRWNLSLNIEALNGHSM